MKTNMGSIDRIARVLVTLVIATLFFTNQITGIAATILLVLAGVFVLTSFVSFCPLYLLFNFNTNKKNQ